MTAVNLTPRAAREQRTFRALMDAMARPGSVREVPLPDTQAWFAALLALAEALVDHEVTFAVLPERAGLTEAILRGTGGRVAPLADAGYVFCLPESLAQALREAKDGTLEYPDRGATVICLADAVSAGTGPGDRLVLSGPGIRDRALVWVGGFPAEARAFFSLRNAAPPMGLDLVLVDPQGHVACLTRYTTLIEEAN